VTAQSLATDETVQAAVAKFWQLLPSKRPTRRGPGALFPSFAALMHRVYRALIVAYDSGDGEGGALVREDWEADRTSWLWCFEGPLTRLLLDTALLWAEGPSVPEVVEFFDAVYEAITEPEAAGVLKRNEEDVKFVAKYALAKLDKSGSEGGGEGEEEEEGGGGGEEGSDSGNEDEYSDEDDEDEDEDDEVSEDDDGEEEESGKNKKEVKAAKKKKVRYTFVEDAFRELSRLEMERLEMESLRGPYTMISEPHKDHEGPMADLLDLLPQNDGWQVALQARALGLSTIGDVARLSETEVAAYSQQNPVETLRSAFAALDALARSYGDDWLDELICPDYVDGSGPVELVFTPDSDMSENQEDWLALFHLHRVRTIGQAAALRIGDVTSALPEVRGAISILRSALEGLHARSIRFHLVEVAEADADRRSVADHKWPVMPLLADDQTALEEALVAPGFLKPGLASMIAAEFPTVGALAAASREALMKLLRAEQLVDEALAALRARWGTVGSCAEIFARPNPEISDLAFSVDVEALASGINENAQVKLESAQREAEEAVLAAEAALETEIESFVTRACRTTDPDEQGQRHEAEIEIVGEAAVVATATGEVVEGRVAGADLGLLVDADFAQEKALFLDVMGFFAADLNMFAKQQQQQQQVPAVSSHAREESSESESDIEDYMEEMKTPKKVHVRIPRVRPNTSASMSRPAPSPPSSPAPRTTRPASARPLGYIDPRVDPAALQLRPQSAIGRVGRSAGRSPERPSVERPRSGFGGASRFPDIKSFRREPGKVDPGLVLQRSVR
jgi:hypothetical protein